MAATVTPDAIVEQIEQYLSVDTNRHPFLSAQIRGLQQQEATNRSSITSNPVTFSQVLPEGIDRDDIDNISLRRLCAAAYVFDPAIDVNARIMFLPNSVHVLSPEAELYLKDLNKRRWGHTESVHNWIFSELSGLIRDNHGNIAWRQLSLAQRIRIYLTIWDTAPLYMVSKMYKKCSDSVDFEVIYETEDSLRRPWQTFFQHCFVWLCEAIYAHRIASQPHTQLQRKEAREGVYASWLRFPRQIHHKHAVVFGSLIVRLKAYVPPEDEPMYERNEVADTDDDDDEDNKDEELVARKKRLIVDVDSWESTGIE